jgi:tRNA1(Val) A37 N6-methylase TrmN6
MASDLRTDKVTEDAVLGGQLRLLQPVRGHRVGHDAILLAAATPARTGEHVIELGAGVGAAGLAVAMRVPRAAVTLIEVDPGLAALAVENADRNQLAVKVLTLDVGLSTKVLRAGTAERVMMNPPFNDPARQRASPDPLRRKAHAAPGGLLARWVQMAAHLLKPRGTLTLIWRADGLADVLSALAPAFGAIMVLPVHAKPGEAAVRVLVRATKSSRAPLALLPALVLNDRAGRPTAEAEAVLREGSVLPLAAI